MTTKDKHCKNCIWAIMPEGIRHCTLAQLMGVGREYYPRFVKEGVVGFYTHCTDWKERRYDKNN